MALSHRRRSSSATLLLLSASLAAAAPPSFHNLYRRDITPTHLDPSIPPTLAPSNAAVPLLDHLIHVFAPSPQSQAPAPSEAAVPLLDELAHVLAPSHEPHTAPSDTAVPLLDELAHDFALAQQSHAPAPSDTAILLLNELAHSLDLSQPSPPPAPHAPNPLPPWVQSHEDNYQAHKPHPPAKRRDTSFPSTFTRTGVPFHIDGVPTDGNVTISIDYDERRLKLEFPVVEGVGYEGVRVWAGCRDPGGVIISPFVNGGGYAGGANWGDEGGGEGEGEGEGEGNAPFQQFMEDGYEANGNGKGANDTTEVKPTMLHYPFNSANNNGCFVDEDASRAECDIPLDDMGDCVRCGKEFHLVTVADVVRDDGTVAVGLGVGDGDDVPETETRRRLPRFFGSGRIDEDDGESGDGDGEGESEDGVTEVLEEVWDTEFVCLCTNAHLYSAVTSTQVVESMVEGISVGTTEFLTSHEITLNPDQTSTSFFTTTSQTTVSFTSTATSTEEILITPEPSLYLDTCWIDGTVTWLPEEEDVRL